jgi:catecholate siderophore receptor
MNSEVLKSATPANVGKTLGNFAKSSANILAKYRITEDLQLGGAYTFESRRFGGQPDTAAPFNATTGIYSQPVPSYSVVDLFATYRVNDNLSARLNVNNVGDVNYYLAAYRAGFFLYKGDARSAKLTLDYAL